MHLRPRCAHSLIQHAHDTNTKVAPFSQSGLFRHKLGKHGDIFNPFWRSIRIDALAGGSNVHKFLTMECTTPPTLDAPTRRVFHFVSSLMKSERHSEDEFSNSNATHLMFDFYITHVITSWHAWKWKIANVNFPFRWTNRICTDFLALIFNAGFIGRTKAFRWIRTGIRIQTHHRTLVRQTRSLNKMILCAALFAWSSSLRAVRALLIVHFSTIRAVQMWNNTCSWR